MRGRPWHPALVHFPIACWVLATLIDVGGHIVALPSGQVGGPGPGQIEAGGAIAAGYGPHSGGVRFDCNPGLWGAILQIAGPDHHFTMI